MLDANYTDVVPFGSELEGLSPVDGPLSRPRRSVDLLCCVCAERPIHARNRCHACYRIFRRSEISLGQDDAHDARLVVTQRRKGRDKAGWMLDDVPEPTLTYAQWCEANGYDPTTRTYKEAAL